MFLYAMQAADAWSVASECSERSREILLAPAWPTSPKGPRRRMARLDREADAHYAIAARKWAVLERATGTKWVPAWAERYIRAPRLP